MGYDLHLTKADDWTDAESQPLSLEGWINFARAAPELTETEAITDGTSPVFLLGDDPTSSPALFWTGGRVVVRGADEPDVAALIRIADSLGVHLIGDDGEVYS